MAGANHVGQMSNEIQAFASGDTVLIPVTTLERYTMPGYTTYDAAFGVAKDNWTVQITGSNLTNSDASTNTSSAQFIKSEVPLRPRVIMGMFGYKF
jgi:outer membrane receptor protein involved in Fe transport